MLDAPVSGGPAKARTGQLATMASGSTRAFQQAEPLVRAYSGELVHIDEQVGAAQTVKAINGMVSRANLAVGCEAIAMAVKAGLDPHKVIEVLNHGTAQSDATLRKIPMALEGRDFGATLHIVAKDMGLWKDEADALGLPSTVGRSAMALYERMISEGGYDQDVLAILACIERWSGVQR